MPLLDRLGLGEPERANVGQAEGGARDVHVGKRPRVQPGGVLGRDDALIGGLVRERRPRHQVADRVHPLARGALRAVHAHESALVELHARVG